MCTRFEFFTNHITFDSRRINSMQLRLLMSSYLQADTKFVTNNTWHLQYHQFTLNAKKMVQTIRILGINTSVSPPTLILSDNGVTVASRGDTVQWIIGPNSGVRSITGVQDNSSVDIFSPDPGPVGGSSNWRGQINSSLPIPSEETYTINFLPVSGNEEYSFDPKIQVNS